jgi:hypothetical protein
MKRQFIIKRLPTKSPRRSPREIFTASVFARHAYTLRRELKRGCLQNVPPIDWRLAA